MAEKVTVPEVAARKVSRGSPPLVMVTAYDAPFARIVDEAGVDLILVGDSVADNVLGYENTLAVTIDDMARHTAAVARTKPRALVVGDMPWMSYHVNPEESLRNAAVLIRAGAGCVKLEGGRKRVPTVRAIIDAEIPVMGHIGLTPQSVHSMGGYRVQGKEARAAEALLADAQALAEAGCFAVVLEGVPDLVAELVTASIDVPTIGIGAGAGCDGQVLVLHDLLGLSDRPVAKFVRRYADLRSVATSAVRQYAEDVRGARFPGADETYHARTDLREALSGAMAEVAVPDTVAEAVAGAVSVAAPEPEDALT
jgi:3-methyl-2-oxobutanoate hydroxymethyltransferase